MVHEAFKLCEFVKLSHTETVIELQRFDQIKGNSRLREGKNSALIGKSFLCCGHKREVLGKILRLQLPVIRGSVQYTMSAFAGEKRVRAFLKKNLKKTTYLFHIFLQLNSWKSSELPVGLALLNNLRLRVFKLIWYILEHVNLAC